MKNIVAGYVIASELKNVTPEDAICLDVINVAFAHCVEGKITFREPDTLEYLPIIRSYNPSIRILVSVGGWGSGGFSPMASTEVGRLGFAQSCLEFATKYSLDGIDIDWEYPCLNWANIEASPDDKVNFTLMLEQVRATFDGAGRQDLMLTIAVGNDQYFIDNTEMDKVALCLDYVSLMTYDMRGCGDRLTGHHTNTYKYGDIAERRSHRSVEHSVEIYNKAGVPLEKLIIGAAFYSRMWTGVEDIDGKEGLNCFSAPSNYGPGYAELKQAYIGQNGFTEYFDERAKAPYIFDGSTFISYDDPRSIAEKCRFVKESGVLGIMYWEHSCDSTRTLLRALRENMK